MGYLYIMSVSETTSNMTFILIFIKMLLNINTLLFLLKLYDPELQN